METRIHFLLTLLQVPGVGWATLHRVLRHASRLEDLLAFPVEQLYLRLKGLPGAMDIARRLTQPEVMHPLAERARAQQADLQRRGIWLLTDHPRLRDLPEARRPPLLFGFGRQELLHRPGYTFLGHPPIRPEVLERAEDLLARTPRVYIGGLHDGLDVTTHRRAGGRSIMVAPCGFARIPPSLRSLVSQTLKAGGTLIAPFPLSHGPFPHDLATARGLQAALAEDVYLLSPPEHTPLAPAHAFATEHRKVHTLY